MTDHSAAPITLYRHPLSGHSHRVELMLSLLGLPTVAVDVDLRAGAHKAPEFLAKNPLGQVPVIEDGDVTLADSNAILVYLATKYDDGRWLPRSPTDAARVQWWLSLAAGPIYSGPCAARLVRVFKAPLNYDRAKSIANDVLRVMDAALAQQPFAIGDAPTIADIAAYTYVAHAPEGGVSLDDVAAVRAWITRIEALPGFVPMQATSVEFRAG